MLKSLPHTQNALEELYIKKILNKFHQGALTMIIVLV